jgi:hypothetical protein
MSWEDIIRNVMTILFSLNECNGEALNEEIYFILNNLNKLYEMFSDLGNITTMNLISYLLDTICI